MQTQTPRPASYRVHHRPVQWVVEELWLGGGDLLDQALYVFAFLLCVGSLATGRPGAVGPEAALLLVFIV